MNGDIVMSYNILLSIIIPVFNVECYLDDCLESLVNQKLASYEIIMVDDGSLDNSGRICDIWAAKFNNIKVIHQQNSGVSVARNNGMQNAKGKYIGFVDPDDWIEPDMFSNMVQSAEYNSCDAVFCGYNEDFEDGRVIKYNPSALGVIDSQQALYQCMLDRTKGYFTSVWNKIFRRDAILNGTDDVLPFQTGVPIGEDELWLVEVLPKIGKVYLDNKAYYHWRQRFNSAIRDRFISEKWVKTVYTKKIILKKLPSDCDFYDIAAGKMYQDLFHTIWKSYCIDDIKGLEFFQKELAGWKLAFWKSRDIPLKRKVKYFIINAMCMMNLPKSWVWKLGNFGLKNLI